MKLSFKDKIRILTTPKENVLVERFATGTYRLYFTNDVTQWPRHEVMDGTLYDIEDARREIETYGELISLSK